MPRHIATRGKHSKEFFNRRGELLHIKELRFWAPSSVLIDKYGVTYSHMVPTQFVRLLALPDFLDTRWVGGRADTSPTAEPSACC